MASVREFPVDLPHAALPGADWADAYKVGVSKPYVNARAAGEAAFATFPSWVHALMAVRNVVVAPFGLKTGKNQKSGQERVGFFPLIEEKDTQLVVGMTDRHLDFRCIVDLAAHESGQDITITTVLKRHNFFGRAYLFVVEPFHKLILRMTMKRLVRGGN